LQVNDEKDVLIMEFCPECGSRLELKKSKVGDDFEVVLACSKCGYKKRGTARSKPKANELINNNIKKSITVISEEDQKLSTLPTLKVECPKCGNNLVYVWQVQTRGGDESSTQFMRCTKCSHTFREYT
jgi:DNA-directed RNA polymerase subunit M